jgi:hypothetical protein
MAQTHRKLPSKEPSRPQLEKLYRFMVEIKELEPWNELWDRDLMLIYFPNEAEPVLCSVMGKNGECYGIGVYPGFNAIMSYFRLVDLGQANFLSMLGFTDCINCYFGSREELDPTERKNIKEMGLIFRGKNNWPYFRRSRPERQPWVISEEDAAVLEQVLEQFIAAYKQYIKDDNLIVNFEKNEILCHRYAPKAHTWITESMRMPPLQFVKPQYIIKNEILIASLKTKKISEFRLEADTIYFPMPCEESSNGEAPYLVRLALLVNVDTKIIIAQRLLNPGEEAVNAIINMLAEYIKEQGRPQKLFVRDNWTGYMYEDFCTKIGIDLDTKEGVPLLDEIANSMMERFTSLSRASQDH